MKIENIDFTGDSYTKPFQSQKYWEFFYIGCHFKSWKYAVIFNDSITKKC